MMYWRLSGFYLFYFASLGALLPYWSLYLKSLDFSITEIGQLMAILMATKIVAPNIWGWIADHTGKRMTIIRMASLLAAISFAGVFLGNAFWWLVLVLVVFSFFWNATLPQFEATTMNHLGDDMHRYSGIRLWGSVGFILAVAGLGALFGQFSVAILPYVLLGLFALIWLNSLCVPESAAGHSCWACASSCRPVTARITPFSACTWRTLVIRPPLSGNSGPSACYPRSVYFC